MIRQAFSLLEAKEVNEQSRTLKGWATTPTVDRVGDIVDPMGMVIRGPTKLHLYHKHDLPVGHIQWGAPSKKGVPFTASIPEVKEPGVVQDRVNEAWHSVVYRLLDAVSIGFRALDWEDIKGTYGTLFKSWEIMELSLVGVPANPDAVITAFKSCNPQIIRRSLGLPTDGTVQLVQVSKSVEPCLVGGAVRLIR